jgi:hypothetical protein
MNANKATVATAVALTVFLFFDVCSTIIFLLYFLGQVLFVIVFYFFFGAAVQTASLRKGVCIHSLFCYQNKKWELTLEK